MRRFSLLFFICTFLICTGGRAQNNLATRLGLPSDARMLIMHADDVGVAHSVNRATFEALQAGTVSSCSIMVPCPWFEEVAQFARDNPELCYGLHLTLTAEWKYYKWTGVACADDISTILDTTGFFYDNVRDVVSHADLSEVETELRAQIEKALRAGIPVSHLDSHMGTLFATPELFKLYVKMGNDYNIPVMIPAPVIPPSWMENVTLGPAQQPLDHIVMLQDFPTDWQSMYDAMLDQVKPGLNEIIVHLGYDDAELQAVMIDHPSFGSTWRENDFNYVMSDAYQRKLKEHNIFLVSYKQILQALQPSKQ